MKNINLLLYLIIMLPLGAKSQKLQVFNGDFSSGLAQNGKAKYTYYEDPETHNYLKQGIFSFSLLGKGDLSGLNQTINGSFEKGLKNGLWTYKTLMTNVSIGSNYVTGSITLIANYKNGYANGNWKLTQSTKAKTWYSAYSAVKNITISMNFLDGSLVGNVSIVDEFENFKASGNYDNNSMCIGTWKIDDFRWGKHRELIYKDNVLYEFIARDNNGEVQEGTRKYQQDYDNYIAYKTMPESEKRDSEFQIVTDCGADNSAATNNIKEYFKKLLSNTNFLYEQIGGDLTYKEGFKSGCEYSVKFSSYFNLDDNPYYKTAEESYSKNDILKAFEFYTKIDSTKIKPSERKKVLDKIAEISPKIETLIEKYHENSKFYNEYIKSQYDSLTTDFNLIKQKFKLKPIKEYDKYTYRYVDKKPVSIKYGQYVNPWDEQYLEDANKCFETNKEFYEPYQKAITEYYFKLNKTLDNETETVKKSSTSITFNNTNNTFYSYDKEKFLSNITEAKKNYDKAKSMMNIALKFEEESKQIEALNEQNKKKTLFNKYSLVLQDYQAKYNAYPDLEESIRILNESIAFLDKVVALYSIETKDIEKLLKDAATVEQIKELILRS